MYMFWHLEKRALMAANNRKIASLVIYEVLLANILELAIIRGIHSRKCIAQSFPTKL